MGTWGEGNFDNDQAVKYLGDLVKQMTATVKEIFAENAAEALRMSPDELRKAMERDVKAWAEVVAATGVKLN